jgi:phosphoribosyl 1,2-cyclic phosphodiesterase
MIAASLQSGSNGNCYVVASQGVGLIVDAGISWSSAQVRLEKLGLHGLKFSGLLITHEHSDHTRSLGTFQRALGVPLHATQKTVESMQSTVLKKVDPVHVRTFRPGSTLEVGPFRVETYRVQHDAVDPVGFVIDDGRSRVGIITDLGRPSRAIQSVISTLDALFIESNFDEDLLTGNARYPELLKERIRGFRGHLENRQSASLVKRHAGVRLRHVLLSHLSEDNNNPDLALAAHRREWEAELPLWPQPELHIAPRNRPSLCIEV